MENSCKSQNPEEEWTVVSSRRRRKPRKQKYHLQICSEPWIPSHDEPNLQGETELMKKIVSSLRRLEKSKFYLQLLDHIQNPNIQTYFSGVLSSESEMPMVIYGIGSIDSREISRLQLSLAILLRKKFDWIGEIEVFDPILCHTEIRVLKSLGFKVLSLNESGKRKVKNPTLFFMPHCEVMLYDNLLAANWQADSLKKIVIFGNSFERYENHISEFQSPIIYCSSHVLATRGFSKEIKIASGSDEFPEAFNDSSFHFFNLDSATELNALKISDE